jgi:NADPH:quinone reductase-like Zn-dependent oxidoreductase
MSDLPDTPDQMRAVVLDDYRPDVEAAIAGLSVASMPVPRPGPGQVLVRMEAAPVNQSDLLFLQGLYGVRKELPAVPGWEGAGTVVASGGGLFARSLRGRRVACGGQTDADGTWAEYFVAPANQCVPLHRDVDFELGANSVVNPLTALGLLEMIRRGRHAAAVQNAAVSQVGLMMTRLCREAGIPLINIVRREEQAEMLRASSEPYVLDSSAAGHHQALRSLAKELRASIAFDAVAGETTGRLLDALPGGATVVVYGALSNEKCRELDPIGLIFHNKRVEAFYLGQWLKGKSFLAALRIVRKSQALIAGGTLRTNVARRIPLSGLREGLTDYVRNLSEGKAILLLK